MQRHYGEDYQGTAQFILMCDRFFDCLNTRSLTEHTNKRKPDLAPYRLVNDSRFQVPTLTEAPFDICCIGKIIMTKVQLFYYSCNVPY